MALLASADRGKSALTVRRMLFLLRLADRPSDAEANGTTPTTPVRRLYMQRGYMQRGVQRGVFARCAARTCYNSLYIFKGARSAPGGGWPPHRDRAARGNR
jgi:hypothetical protein